MVRERLSERFDAIFHALGGRVVTLKHGELQMAGFAEPRSAALPSWINVCPNQLYCAPMFQGGTAWRKPLLEEIGDQGLV